MKMNVPIANISTTAVSQNPNNVEVEKIVDTIMFFTFIASLVISPILIIYFIKVYCCVKRDASISKLNRDVVETSVECVGKKKGILMEDHFNIVEAENPLLGRSAASSMDHGYLADYIKCEAVNQQAESGEV